MGFITDLEQMGIEKGFKIGWEKGSEQNTRVIAKKMLEEGCNRSVIQRVTELSCGELLSLANELKESTDST